MNYQLMRGGLLPININTQDRIKYYECLDTYASKRVLEPFADFVAEIEEKRINELLNIHFDEKMYNQEQPQTDMTNGIHM